MKSRRETLEDFVARDPNDVFSRYGLALELEKSGRDQEAASQLKEVISRDPSCIAAYYQLGKILARTDEIGAREVYRQGIDAATAANDLRARSEMQQALDMLN